MSSLGQQLLSRPPATWVQLHESAWPIERLGFQDVAGRLLSAALVGEALIVHRAGPDKPARVELRDLTEVDREALELTLPEPFEPGKPATGPIRLDALLVPTAVRTNPTWVITQLPARSWIELTTLDALLCQQLLGPVMADLAAIFDLRAGIGPASEKGKREKLQDCRQAHEALGLHADLLEPLLDPGLPRQDVIRARQALVLSWAEHPEDLGPRLIALLCGRLARAYYAKARKNGTVEQARVINTKTKPWLEMTLRDWSAFVAYLGESLSEADARPVAIPEIALPDAPPPPVRDRIETLRDWWHLYDRLQASLEPGRRGLLGLVPRRWGLGYLDEEFESHEPELYRRMLPEELISRVERLWGFAVLPRYPEVLVTQPHPFETFAELLSPAIDVWDEVATTSWSLCFATYSRWTLHQLEGHHADARAELERLSAPIPTSLYSELNEAGRGHDWLFEPRPLEIGVEISVSDGRVIARESEPPGPPKTGRAVFVALKEILDRHRATWLAKHLEPLLDALWRRDVAVAATNYWNRYRGRGRAPTLKQALPDVQATAERWFNADYAAFARLAGLEGPVTSSPSRSDRRLPSDLFALTREIASLIAPSAETSELDQRVKGYRLMQFANQGRKILAYWQATGVAPERGAVLGARYSPLCEELLRCDLEDGYKLLLAATREALRRLEPGRVSRRLRIEDDLSSGQENLQRCQEDGSTHRS